MKKRLPITLALLTAALAFSGPARADKLRDLTDVSGVRENQLLGYGIVTGLNGTGDDTSSPIAAQTVLSMLRRLGVQVDPRQVRLKNVAAVVVTGSLGGFAKTGTKLDITVSSIGNAKSLAGGVLVQTLLKGADQKTYAVAQGNILTGGFKAGGSSGGSVQSGSTTAARIPEGAIIEREVPTTFVTDGALKLSLRTPSFTVASHAVAAIDKSLGEGTAHADDSGTVIVKIPAKYQKNPVDLIAALEEIEVGVVRRARVVVSERTQTIVAGGDVRLSPAVVVHGGLTIVVKENPVVSQPTAPLGKGTTAVVPRTTIDVSEGEKDVRLMPAAAKLADVASALGALGLSPRELAGVLEALRTAGALEAEVVIQ
jgi:flagellar P-ring protein precursor FlgI